jgi:NDP-sugar pyrophosphorylase family protein
MRPLTERFPKILLDVAGRPFAEWQLELLRCNGVRRVVYCVGFRGEQVREALGDGSRWGMDFEFVFDGPVLLGTGGALRNALPALGDEFFVLYGDSYLPCRFPDVEAAFRAEAAARGLMTVFRNEGQWDTSNVEFAEGRIRAYDKRTQTPAMRHIDYGLGILTPAALAGYPAGEPLDLATVYRDLLAARCLAACEVRERFYEIGSPAGLAELREMAERDGRLPV